MHAYPTLLTLIPLLLPLASPAPQGICGTGCSIFDPDASTKDKWNDEIGWVDKDKISIWAWASSNTYDKNSLHVQDFYHQTAMKPSKASTTELTLDTETRLWKPREMMKKPGLRLDIPWIPYPVDFYYQSIQEFNSIFKNMSWNAAYGMSAEYVQFIFHNDGDNEPVTWTVVNTELTKDKILGIPQTPTKMTTTPNCQFQWRDHTQGSARQQFRCLMPLPEKKMR